ncbi:MAG: bifunctional oligoribonuclease/PAP phosphatase NrnA [Lachnospiraceae bacterium]|nr:bifunctional oligoribonuclease/PAP phosphatase NrnA [Lachnospiraceae bacterium]
MINDLLEEIGSPETIGISGHIRPDGDCVGSVLGMYAYLTNAYKDAKIKIFLDQPPAIYSYMKGYDEVDTTFAYPGQFDVFIALDSGDVERIGDAAKLFLGAKKSICIDHHVSNSGYGDVFHIEPDASSTCEILTRMFKDEYMDVEVAKALYTGIAHDTGVFRYSCTGPDTFDALSRLVKYGFDATKITDETFYQKSYVQNQLLGRTLLESIIFMDGRCIAGYVDRKAMEFYEAKPSDFEGIVNQLQMTKGVEVAIFMYEIGTLEFKVSMRSNGKVNVAEVAEYFGGGGHVRAAGCNMNGTFHDVLNNLSLHIERQLDALEEKDAQAPV